MGGIDFKAVLVLAHNAIQIISWGYVFLALFPSGPQTSIFRLSDYEFT